MVGRDENFFLHEKAASPAQERGMSDGGPGEQVLAVLGLTNLDRILRPYATVEDARGEW